jgi:hypothetical protein
VVAMRAGLDHSVINSANVTAASRGRPDCMPARDLQARRGPRPRRLGSHRTGRIPPVTLGPVTGSLDL